MAARDIMRNRPALAWLSLAALLSVGGAAGCLGRYFPWAGPFAWLDEAYQALIAKPLLLTLGLLAPSGAAGVPGCLADYLVVGAGVFIMVNVTWRHVMGQALIDDAFRDSGRLGGAAFLFFTFALTPALLPFFRLTLGSISQEGQTLVRLQLRCYFAWAGVALAMAAANQALKAL